MGLPLNPEANEAKTISGQVNRNPCVRWLRMIFLRNPALAVVNLEPLVSTHSRDPVSHAWRRC